MAVLLALVAAVAYGVADFVGGVASKRAPVWAVASVVQVVGTLAILVLHLLAPAVPTAADLVWAALAGAANGVGTFFLYRGLASGRMGVVAPVSGVGAALVPTGIALALGERLPPLVWVGLLAAIPGIWLVAREPVAASAGGTRTGFLDGVLAGLGFGLLFAGLGQVPESAGWLPLALNQAVACVVIVGAAVVLRAPWFPRQPAAWLGAVSGVLAAVATGGFVLAAQRGYLAVAAVLTSLYPAVTVVLAATLLREHIHAGRVAGLGLCGLAVVLVALG